MCIRKTNEHQHIHTNYMYTQINFQIKCLQWYKTKEVEKETRNAKGDDGW